ncbi:MAG TPA: tRNA uridine-5-carboxymethylaminomethyl(34) synthesis GTPase MnmE [Thermodesulfovibrionales bacterium]|nr:tRNA uridine-5-carboxymethylaminomethyl(34) synthesis GTPase MnmE [Thermodesulfovibrionales bacterium]
MFTDDTIAAISTPPGEGGIGIVRLSGGDAIGIVERFFTSPKKKKLEDTKSHRLVYGFIKDPRTGATVGEVLVAVMRAPHTYTKEDVVEINCHGGILPLRAVLELVLKQGARLAEPGEFTKRAFLNGRIDLSQAEAVIDVIRAKTDESGRIALGQLSGGLSDEITSLRDRVASLSAQIEAEIDFPEDEIEPVSKENILLEIEDITKGLVLLSASFDEGRFFREGLKVAIVGRPNVGKSSLLNALLKRDRAIVTETPGTTRDVLEEYLNMKGLPVRIMDTAGIRETHEMAEREGVRRSLRAIDDADVVICLIDGSMPLHDEDREVLERTKERNTLIAINKSDLPLSDASLEPGLKAYAENVLKISAATGMGLDNLKDRITEMAFIGNGKPAGRSFGEGSSIMVTNVRHKLALDDAEGALRRAGELFQESHPLEIVAIEFRTALDRLGEIVGAVTTEDILNRIFSEFCIGK